RWLCMEPSATQRGTDLRLVCSVSASSVARHSRSGLVLIGQTRRHNLVLIGRK
ncbi:hypothetical protein O3P69_015529, partial [Scylla paramamosain]